jgi:phosphonate transport system substrate-binding protein
LFLPYLLPSCCRRWTCVFASVFASWLLVASLTTPALAEPVYTLGVVPQFDQRKLFTIWKPIVDELSRRTNLDLRLEFTLTISDFETALKKGKFDFVYTNPYEILWTSGSQGYIPLVRDQAPLRGILVVRRDSPMKDVKELQGQTLAVPSPNALGASLLLRADLERLYGVHMTMVNVKTHSSVYIHVLNGLTSAGGGIQKTLSEQGSEVQEGLRILYTTRPIPSHPLAAHPRVPQEIRERVRKALLEMGYGPETRTLLSKIPMPSPVPATMADYLTMQPWGLDAYWVEDENKE